MEKKSKRSSRDEAEPWWQSSEGFVVLGLAECPEAKQQETRKSLQLGLKVIDKDNRLGIWKNSYSTEEFPDHSWK